LVSAAPLSADFRSVHLRADVGSEFENRRSRKATVGSNPSSSAKRRRFPRGRCAPARRRTVVCRVTCGQK
jgi:hypothetical protein